MDCGKLMSAQCRLVLLLSSGLTHHLVCHVLGLTVLPFVSPLILYCFLLL